MPDTTESPPEKGQPPLDIVTVDRSEMELFVIDHTMDHANRPTMTTITDVFTGCCVGFSVNVEPLA